MSAEELKLVAKSLKAVREKKLSYEEKEERMINALKEYHKEKENESIKKTK